MIYVISAHRYCQNSNIHYVDLTAKICDYNFCNVKTTTYKMLFQTYNIQNNKNHVIIISAMLKQQSLTCYFKHLTFKIKTKIM